MSGKNKQTKAESQSTDNVIRGFRALVVLLALLGIGWFVYQNTFGYEPTRPFKLGLDLAGGSHLVYEADVSGVEPSEVSELMNVLRDVIERRVNVFGVAEPIVQVEHSSIVSNVQAERLVVELPGVADVNEAVAEIGKTPLLEFKLIDSEKAKELEAQNAYENFVGTSTASTTELEKIDPFIATGLTGRYLESAALEFFGQNHSGGLANEPIVSVRFNSEGADLFEEITANHTGEQLAIFLDGELISAPRINERISGGTAIISGGFTPDEAKALAENLNFGALPIPIKLQSTQTIGATLGQGVLEKGIKAGLVGMGLVIVFMLFWYRLPGLVAGVALIFFMVSMLALFQLVPVTITAAGLAGLILAIGMAVDANVLVFERMKEEYINGKDSREAAREGFSRAWSAIRDGNITSLLSAIILFWFGTSIVKGFALVFGMGVIVSMISALTVTRTLLMALPAAKLSDNTLLAKLYKCGIKNL